MHAVLMVLPSEYTQNLTASLHLHRPPSLCIAPSSGPLPSLSSAIMPSSHSGRSTLVTFASDRQAPLLKLPPKSPTSEGPRNPSFIHNSASALSDLLAPWSATPSVPAPAPHQPTGWASSAWALHSLSTGHTPTLPTRPTPQHPSNHGAPPSHPYQEWPPCPPT